MRREEFGKAAARGFPEFQSSNSLLVLGRDIPKIPNFPLHPNPGVSPFPPSWNQGIPPSQDLGCPEFPSHSHGIPQLLPLEFLEFQPKPIQVNSPKIP